MTRAGNADHEEVVVRIAMVGGRSDPERDGVAGYTATLGAVLGADGAEV